MVSILGSADSVDSSSMTFEELVELRSLIDEQLMTLYPDYNFILYGGNCYFDIDLELEKFFSKPFSTYNQPQNGWKSGWNKKKKPQKLRISKVFNGGATRIRTGE